MAINGFTGMAYPLKFNGLGKISSSSVEPGNPAHIMESIRQIIGTRQGERVMRPEFGANLEDLVFMPQSHTEISVAVHNIGTQVARWEKRVNLKNADVTRIADTKTEVNLDVEILATRKTEEVNISLESSNTTNS